MIRRASNTETFTKYISRIGRAGLIVMAGLWLAVPAFAENYLVFATKDFRYQNYIDTDRITEGPEGFAAWRLSADYSDRAGYTYAWVLNHYYCRERKIVSVASLSYDEDWSVVDTYSGGTGLENVEPGDVNDRMMAFVCEAEDKRWERTVFDAPQDLSETIKMARKLAETLYYDDEKRSLVLKKQRE